MKQRMMMKMEKRKQERVKKGKMKWIQFLDSISLTIPIFFFFSSDYIVIMFLV